MPRAKSPGHVVIVKQLAALVEILTATAPAPSEEVATVTMGCVALLLGMLAITIVPPSDRPAMLAILKQSADQWSVRYSTDRDNPLRAAYNRLELGG